MRRAPGPGHVPIHGLVKPVRPCAPWALTRAPLQMRATTPREVMCRCRSRPAMSTRHCRWRGLGPVPSVPLPQPANPDRVGAFASAHHSLRCTSHQEQAGYDIATVYMEGVADHACLASQRRHCERWPSGTPSYARGTATGRDSFTGSRQCCLRAFLPAHGVADEGWCRRMILASPGRIAPALAKCCPALRPASGNLAGEDAAERGPPLHQAKEIRIRGPHNVCMFTFVSWLTWQEAEP